MDDVDLDTLTLRVWVYVSQQVFPRPAPDLASELHTWLAAYARSIECPLLPTDLLLPASSGPRYRWRTSVGGVKERYQAPWTSTHCDARLDLVVLPRIPSPVASFTRPKPTGQAGRWN